ncbi:MAG TPA: hypothetical protein PK986_01165 [Spirochaetota bacterium]|nr:hypothetical protein [Spirochaetota bacterium]HQO39053.1 hypothetical protein [Spirochaetota bacterium]
MPRISRKIALLLSMLLIFTACAKKPEKANSPSIKIGIEKRGTETVYIADFTCTLKNENDSTAFLNASGKINIKDNSGNLLLPVPFTVKTILPFEAGVVLQRVELKESEAVALMQFLDISPEKILSGEDTGARPLEDVNIELAGLKLEKKDIIDLLKGK